MIWVPSFCGPQFLTGNGTFLMKITLELLAISFITACLSSPVAAQQAGDYHPFLTNKFNLGVGAYYP
jgi:hypothetical protein